MTRLELLDLWFKSVPQARQRTTIIALYQGVGNAVKDAMIAAMKADLVAVLQPQATLADQANSALEGEITEVTGVV